MKSVFDSAFAQVLRRLANLVCGRRKWFVMPQVILAALCLIYTARYLKIDTDRDNLVGSESKYQRVFMEYRKEFPGEDELAAVVESGSMERNRQFVERLAARIEQETNLFTDVFYKGDLKALGPKALLFTPEDDLKDLQKILRDDRPFIREFTQATNLDSLFTLINKQFRTAKREQNAENDSLIKAIPALQRIIDQATASIGLPGTPVSPGLYALFGVDKEAEARIYLTFAKGRIYLLTARARNPEVVEQAVVRMRQLMEQTEFEIPGVNAGLTGQPVLDYDEGQQSEHDSILATIVSLVVCSMIFIYAYRQTGRPLKAVACLMVGLGYTMGFATLTVGHLNILTITFAPILTGLAIDFGIHFITRYEEEMRRGRSPEEAVTTAMVFTGQGIVTGALTTAVAFVAMAFTNFKGIREMGIISGGGLALCLVPMMTMLPALLMQGRQNVIDHAAGDVAERRMRIEKFWLDRPGWVVMVSIVICTLAAMQFQKVFFDYNLLHMQSKGLASVEYDEKLAYSGESVLFAAIVADSLQQAREYEEKVKKLQSVYSVDGDDKGDPIYKVLLSDQTHKLEMVNSIKADLSSIRFQAPDEKPARLHELSSTLWSTMGYLGLAADETAKEQPDLAGQLRALRESINELRVKMLNDDPEIPPRLLGYQKALFNDIRDTFDGIQTQDTSDGGLKPKDLPTALAHQFIGVTGKYRVLVFPKKDIWDHDNQAEFVAQLRTIAPEDRVTDYPVQLYESTTLLKDSYVQAAWYALGAIAIMVLVHFRSIPCVFLALAPVAMGTIWMVGFMGKTGIPFNPADIMTLPLVIGIGVTNGIHILNRFAEEHHAGILAKSTGKAVLVSGLTAITGFGSLMLGKHQGIKSLGAVMSVGIATCMIAGLTFLPAVLTLLVRSGWSMEKKRPSGDNAKPPLSLEEPR